jgi:hypothetical protein
MREREGGARRWSPSGGPLPPWASWMEQEGPYWRVRWWYSVVVSISGCDPLDPGSNPGTAILFVLFSFVFVFVFLLLQDFRFPLVWFGGAVSSSEDQRHRCQNKGWSLGK